MQKTTLDMNKLLEALNEGVCTVTYKKIEGPNTGKLRNMVCTLNPEIIPGHTNVKQKATTHHLLVWCIDRENWRSVSVETIKEWQVGQSNGEG